jgi:hypothetical protein
MMPHQWHQQRCRSKNAEMSMEITAFMRERIGPYWRTVALTAVVQFVLFLRWLCRSIRNDEVTRTFLEDMVNRHLRRIGRQREKFRDEKGIEPPAEPPTRWVNLNSLDGDGDG